MCLKLALRPDPDGPISIPARPAGRPPPSPPRSSRVPRSSRRWAELEERSPRASDYYVETRSPRFSSHSTLPVDLVERTPKPAGRSAHSPRITQERSPRSSNSTFPPRMTPLDIPIPDPPLPFPETHLHPGFGRSPDSLGAPPPGPRVPRHSHTSSSSTTVTSSSTNSSYPRDRRYRASSLATSPRLSDTFETRERDLSERPGSRRYTRAAENHDLADGNNGPRSPRLHQNNHCHNRHQSSGDHASGATNNAPRLPLEDPATARRAQLAEERALLGEDGVRRTQYYYR